MRTIELKKHGQILIPQVKVARGFFVRFMGLMGKAEVPKNEAILFPKCNSIHTFFMRIPIDVVFLASDGAVLEVLTALKPWRMLAPKSKVKHTLEMQAGRSQELGIHVGDILKCEGVF